MDKIKKLLDAEFNQIVVEKEFNRELLAKDYHITLILYFLKDVKGILFKGGTALQKAFLDYSRISEDIDLTLERNLGSVKKDIVSILNKSQEFGKIAKDKDVTMFTRLIVPYDNDFGKSEIFIDLNERAKLLLKPAILDMVHFYPNIPKFSFPCLSKKEMVAEKVAAAIGRNMPRDHYDIYQIIKHKLPIDMKLVSKKCKLSGNDPNILKMFNNAKKLYKRWNHDMLPLISKEVSFVEVMSTLSKHFKLKEEKKKLK